MTRKYFLNTLGIGFFSLKTFDMFGKMLHPKHASTHQLPALPYPYQALEPNIDALTMEIHHSKHHQAYINNLNKAINGTEWAKKTLEQIFLGINATTPAAVRNNAGGHYNHTLFWQMLSPTGGGEPVGKLAKNIIKTFGSTNEFKKQFADAAKNRFGSGWAWLILQNGKLIICSTPNQDNPLMSVADHQGSIILGLDVWEHAYYLQYQNRRTDYITAFWNVINWHQAEKNYLAARKRS